MKHELTIVNLEIGNIGSLVNMLKRLGVRAHVTNSPNEIANSKKIILPGVGAFDTACEAINKFQLREILSRKALSEKIPFLGICLGMQLLLDSSEEGECKGLGFIQGEVKRFDVNGDIKVPHMGWNHLEVCQPENILSRSIEERTRFYFVHSFFAQVKNQEHILFKTNHGITFHSGIQKENIIGFQFHPEKSHQYGLRLLESFLRLKC